MFKCKKCQREYDTLENAEKCEKFHDVPFKYERGCLVSVFGNIGILLDGIKVHDNDFSKLPNCETTPAEITGSNFYRFRIGKDPVPREEHFYCVNEYDIEFLKTNEEAKQMLLKNVYVLRQIYEKYGPRYRTQSYIDRTMHVVICEYDDKTITVKDGEMEIKLKEEKTK